MRERHYSLDAQPLTDVTELLNALARATPPISEHALDALATEVRRTSRDRRRASATSSDDRTTSQEQTAWT